MYRLSLHAQGPEISRLVYGVWRIADDPDTSDAHVRAKIDACLEQGISSFDHADIYGDYSCEALFGRAIAADPALRQRMELISKCDIALMSMRYPKRRVKFYDTSAAYITAQVETSLRNLHTDYLDAVLIHRPDPLMDPQETGAALDALIDDGKTRSVGVSNFMPWDTELLQSAMRHPLVTNQIEINPLERSAFTDGRIAQAQRLKMAPMAWSPLAGGQLFASEHAPLQEVLGRIANEQSVQMSEVAIGWLLAHPAQIVPVLGTNNIDRISRLHTALAVQLDRETWFEIWTAAAGQEVP